MTGRVNIPMCGNSSGTVPVHPFFGNTSMSNLAKTPARALAGKATVGNVPESDKFPVRSRSLTGERLDVRPSGYTTSFTGHCDKNCKLQGLRRHGFDDSNVRNDVLPTPQTLRQLMTESHKYGCQ
jgi:hypothetical protein